MSVFGHIKDVKYQVELLKKQIPYIKDQHQLNNHIKLTNSIILLINDMEYVLENRIHTETIDKLILALIHVGFKNNGTKALYGIIKEVNEVIKYPKSLQMEHLTELLIDAQRELLLIKLPVKTNGKWKKFKMTFPKTKIDSNKITDEEIENIRKQLLNETTPEEYEELLNKQLIDIKNNIQWN